MSVAALQEWLKQPFDQGMSAYRWLAFVGLIIACAVIWHIILSHLAEV
jgi:hypothetical protein